MERGTVLLQQESVGKNKPGKKVVAAAYLWYICVSTNSVLGNVQFMVERTLSDV